MIDVALVAEFEAAIGTGHLVETFDIAAAAQTSGIQPVVVVPASTPSRLLARCPVPIEIVPNLLPETLREAGDRLAARGARLAVTNFRRVSNSQVVALAAAGLRVVCIDELGGRDLDCVAVINSSPVRSRHCYTSRIPGFRVHAGPEYLALSAEYCRRREVPRRFSGAIRSVVLSMGGVDRTGATLRIIEALRGWTSEAERHIVVGAAFAWGEALERLVSDLPGRWRIHHNLPSLAELLATADVGISAGGNTLFEMACIGTPALVLYEDEHEAEQGRAFEASGFGWCLGAGTEVSADAIRQALHRLEDPALRRAQSEAGRRLVDGHGAARIGRIVAEYVAVDSPLAT